MMSRTLLAVSEITTATPPARPASARGKLRAAWSSVLASLLVALAATAANAQTAPKVVLTQSTLLGGFPSGGAFGSGTAAGTNFAVNSRGYVLYGTSYGNNLVQLNGTTGVSTTLGTDNNLGPIAIDASDNLYIGNVYSSTIVKLPFVSGAYAAFSAPSSTTPVCTGSDTAECVLPSSIVNGPYGVASMTIDSKGNLFYSSTNAGSSADHTIFECNAACLASATPKPVAIYTEPTSSTAQLLVGGMSVDPYGDLFFTDSAFPDQGNEESSASYVNELTYTGTGATGFSATKTVLYTYTVASPSKYDNEITSVLTDANGTVYFATEFDGIFGFPNNKGVVNTSTLYTFSTAGAKAMATDGKGNFYVVNYSNTTGGDAMTHVGINVLTAPQSNLGSSTTSANITTILNSITNCTSTAVSYAATSGSATSTEFSAATSGTCASANITGASAIPTTLTFTPSSAGVRTATITATDANSNTGAATASSIGVGSPAATPTFSPAAGTYTSIQTVTLSDATPGAILYYTTDGSTPTTSSTVFAPGSSITVASSETIKAIATAVGFGTSAVGSANYVLNLPTAAPNFTPAAGTYNATQSVTLSDTTTGAVIYYTTDGSTPTTSSTQYTAPISVAATETIKAIAAAPGYTSSSVASSTYTINLPTIGLAINPGSLTIASGGQGLANVVVTPLNTFSGTVSFSCSGLPAGASCSFSPTSVTASGTYPAVTVLTINAQTLTSSNHNSRNPLAPVAGTTTLALALCLMGWKRRRAFSLLAMGLMATALTLMSGCSSGTSQTHTPQTSTVTVLAKSGTITQSATLTVTVQ